RPRVVVVLSKLAWCTQARNEVETSASTLEHDEQLLRSWVGIDRDSGRGTVAALGAVERHPSPRTTWRVDGGREGVLREFLRRFLFQGGRLPASGNYKEGT